MLSIHWLTVGIEQLEFVSWPVKHRLTYQQGPIFHQTIFLRDTCIEIGSEFFNGLLGVWASGKSIEERVTRGIFVFASSRFLQQNIAQQKLTKNRKEQKDNNAVHSLIYGGNRATCTRCVERQTSTYLSTRPNFRPDNLPLWSLR